jgi:hypothetical protein
MGFTKKQYRIFTLVGFLVLIVVLIVCVNNSNLFTEHFAPKEYPQVPMAAEDVNVDNSMLVDDADSNEIPAPVQDSSSKDESQKEHFEGGSATNIPSCLPKDQLMPQELLPQDSESNQWSLANPQGSGSLKDKNFLQAGYHVGINTVGQTLRNANMQLRSDPPNPQVQVSPWLQTTINPDTNRKPMEIGGCA